MIFCLLFNSTIDHTCFNIEAAQRYAAPDPPAIVAKLNFENRAMGRVRASHRITSATTQAGAR